MKRRVVIFTISGILSLIIKVGYETMDRQGVARPMDMHRRCLVGKPQ